MVSNTKNIEVCDRHARRINVPYIQTYSWKEKLEEKSWSQVRDLREFIETLYEGEYVSYSLEYFQHFLNFMRSLVLNPSGQTNFIIVLN